MMLLCRTTRSYLSLFFTNAHGDASAFSHNISRSISTQQKGMQIPATPAIAHYMPTAMQKRFLPDAHTDPGYRAVWRPFAASLSRCSRDVRP